MDSRKVAFEDLERVQGYAEFSFGYLDPLAAPNSIPFVPGSYPDYADSDHEHGSAILARDQDTHVDLSHDTTPTVVGLPPTPPTVLYSEDSEATDSRQLNPGKRLHADSHSNELRSQPSGFSSPGLDWYSLPTPQPSPAGTREPLLRPVNRVLHHHSSSYADSFGTAPEGRIATESMASSRSNSPAAQNFSISAPASNLETADAEPQRQPNWTSSGVSSDQDDHPPPGSILQHESRARDHPSSFVAANVTAEPALPSSTLARTLSQGTAQLRLRALIQPGDNIKRPDESLLYTKRSPVIVHRRSGSLGDEIQKISDATPTGVTQERSTPMPNVPSHNREQNATRPSDIETAQPERRESAPLEPPGDVFEALPRTPPSATKSSLDDNNVVYKLIREENVKRHSNISDGSVQAVVVVLPEYRRTLRHTPKRHSLRGDASHTSNSHRSSAESGKKSMKRHTDTTLSTSDTDLTSPDVSPIVEKIVTRPTAVTQMPPDISPQKFAPIDLRRANRNVPSRTKNSSARRYSSGGPPMQHQALRRATKDYTVSRTDLPPYEDPTTMQRGTSPPFHQAAHLSSKPVYIPLMSLRTTPRLRRSSNESRLEKHPEVRRTSLDESVNRLSQPLEVKLEQVAQELTREGQELPDERLSLAIPSTLTSPKRRSFDVHSHQPTHASFSVSQASFRSDVELLEARGISIFPHHNESLVVVQQASRPASKGDDLEVSTARAGNSEAGNNQPQLTVTSPGASSFPAIAATAKSKHAVDSPLTNPRAPPEPPIIKFIPPTPSEELDLDIPPGEEQAPVISGAVPHRQSSISRRVRRYSESLMQPLGLMRLGSVRKTPNVQPQPQQRKHIPAVSVERPTHLSSFWQPRDFWEEYDSDSDDDLSGGHDSATAHAAALPVGGDTSNIGNNNKQRPATSASFFPRNMSVRMPGFRGTGGFLVGNSLGIDRHGTNNRRHYVHRPQRPSPKASAEAVQRVVERRRQRRTFAIPFVHGVHIECVGLRYLRSHVRSMRARRAELALEKRREKLRHRIGMHVYHGL